LVSGESSRSARIAAAKWPAPASGRSSRSTLVTTRYLSASWLTASARWRGSSGSSASGRPLFTWQKRQPRVHTSPISITVAVPPFQHSAMFGQRDSAHTVFSLSRLSRSRTRS
jgi:hypothetical protein